MHKIACVFSFQKSSWVSCQKIVFNLHETWQQNKNLQLENFNLETELNTHQLQQLAKGIVAADPDTIVILDHKPHPSTLFEILVPLLAGKKTKPKILFHVFGDFTLYYPAWAKLGALLEGFPVKFLVASERQKKLIDLFLLPPFSSDICPFPVNAKEFSFESGLREQKRKEWGLKQDDIALVFTGRLSRQKRIHTLMNLFAETVTETKTQNLHLFLYGNPDHIADPFMGKWETEGEYFRKIYRLYEKMPTAIKSKIHFMGGVPNSELKAVYHGADYLMNLSVHNDEDYGMSVAEAQCSGLPSVLTDWGGLASFAHAELPEATLFIPVKIGLKNKMISREAVKVALQKILKNETSVDRQKLSDLALASVGIAPASEQLKGIYEGEWHNFTTFSDFFQNVLLKTSFNALPYLSESRKINSLYREIYSSYVRND